MQIRQGGGNSCYISKFSNPLGPGAKRFPSEVDEISGQSRKILQRRGDSYLNLFFFLGEDKSQKQGFRKGERGDPTFPPPLPWPIKMDNRAENSSIDGGIERKFPQGCLNREEGDFEYICSPQTNVVLFKHRSKLEKNFLKKVKFCIFYMLQ